MSSPGPMFGDGRVRLTVWDRIVTSEVECPWMWIGFTDRGYARVVADGGGRKPYLARYLYEKLVGPVPEGMQVEHTCHSADPDCYGGERCPHRLCATPGHFALISAEENKRRRHHRSLEVIEPRGRLVQRCPSNHPLVGTNSMWVDGEVRCRLCVVHGGQFPRRPGALANRYGFVTAEGTPTGAFWANFDDVDGCWRWRGPSKASGYGYVVIRGKRVPAHRVAFEHAQGAVPEGLVLDHRCHTDAPDCAGGDTCLHRLCINPAHLEPVSGAENTARMRSPYAARTQCPVGHVYDQENTRWYRGMRYCIACSKGPARRASQDAWREANPDRVKAIQKRARVKHRDKRNAAMRAWHAARKAEREQSGEPTPFRQQVLDAVIGKLIGDDSVEIVVRELAVELGTPNKTNVTRALLWLVERGWLARDPDGALRRGQRSAG